MARKLGKEQIYLLKRIYESEAEERPIREHPFCRVEASLEKRGLITVGDALRLRHDGTHNVQPNSLRLTAEGLAIVEVLVDVEEDGVLRERFS